MLYAETDILQNKARMKREARRAALLALPMLALAIAGFLIRSQPLCLAGALLCGGVLIFLGDLRVAPLWRYGKFLREITGGLSHKTAGTLVRLGEEPVFEDGVWMRECILNIYEDQSEEGERRFLLDCAKTLPDGLLGRDVALTSHGNAVLGVEPLGSAS